MSDTPKEKAPKTPKEKAPDEAATPEPARTELGDIDPALVEWRRQNWKKEDFDALYPLARLRKIGA